ncbi:MAG: tetratricopeptide repeat protein, partial [Pedosphaera parvula]|nr:tetratricopeptide repeat protein [Pedosphaera parvula]
MNSEGSFSTGFYQFLGWLDENKKHVAVAGSLLVLVGFAIYIWRHQVQQKELRASTALLSVRAPVTAEAPASSVPAADFLKVQAEYAGTEAAIRAEFLAAGALFNENKYAEAQKAFETFVQNRADNPLAGAAAYGLGAALEAQGKKDEALTAYQNVITRYPNDAVVSQAKLAVARLYESKNQPDQAFRFYEEVAKATNSTWRSDAGMLRAALLAKHPDLEKKAAPASPAKPLTPPVISTNSAASSAVATNRDAATNSTKVPAPVTAP